MKKKFEKVNPLKDGPFLEKDMLTVDIFNDYDPLVNLSLP